MTTTLKTLPLGPITFANNSGMPTLSSVSSSHRTPVKTAQVQKAQTTNETSQIGRQNYINQQQMRQPVHNSNNPGFVLPKSMLIPAADYVPSPSKNNSSNINNTNQACANNLTPPPNFNEKAKVMVIKRIQKKVKKSTEQQQQLLVNESSVTHQSRFRSGAQKQSLFQNQSEQATKSDKKPQQQSQSLTPVSDKHVKLDRKRSAILLDNYRSHLLVAASNQANLNQPRAVSLCNSTTNHHKPEQQAHQVLPTRSVLRTNHPSSFNSQQKQNNFSPSPLTQKNQTSDFMQMIKQCLVPDYQNNPAQSNQNQDVMSQGANPKPCSKLIKLRARSTARFSLYKSQSSLHQTDSEKQIINNFQGSPKAVSHSTASTQNAACARQDARKDSGILSVASLRSASQQMQRERSHSGQIKLTQNPIKPCVQIRRSMHESTTQQVAPNAVQQYY